MHAILLCCFAQLITFDDQMGHAKVSGSPEQIISYYEDWREHCEPNWRSQSQTWWNKEHARVVKDANSRWNSYLLFANDQRTRAATIQTIVFRGYTARFLVQVHPFCSFFVYYHTLWYGAALGVFLVTVIYWLKFRRRRGNNASAEL